MPAIFAVSPPDPPKLTNGTVTTNSVNLFWSVPATNGGTGTITYDVQRSIDGSTFLSQTIQSAITYTDTWPFSSAEDYVWYRIYSNDTAGWSDGYGFPLNQTYSNSAIVHIPYDSVLTNQGKTANVLTSTGGTTYTPGHNGYARNFTGTDYDTFGTETVFDFETNNAFTFSFWVYPVTGIANQDVIFAKSNDIDSSPTGAGFGFLYGTTDTVLFRMVNTTNSLFGLSTSTIITENQWHHVVLTYDGSGNADGLTFYVNGTMNSVGATNTINGSILNNLSPVISAESDGGRIANMYIDDFRVFNVELNSHEAVQLFYERLDASDLVPPVTYNTAPTGLVASAESSTQIDLDWTAPTGMTNINGYRIQRETPINTGWATIVSNTTNTNAYYNNTGLTTNIIYNYRVYSLNGTGISNASNEYDMTTFHLPDAVDDLTGTASDFSTVDLSWTAPTSYAPEITGYRINYTTPEGDPQTIVTPDPYTTTASATLFNLVVGDIYSFRVAPITIHGTNASGNIFNITTSTTYTLGNLTSPDQTNTEDFAIFFERDDINATSLFLNVTYSDTYDLNCNFAYQLARTNDTYANLTSTVVDADNVESSFLFVNATGDIIHVRCWDVITDDEAMYVLTITDFPFLDQISNMRNGTYGTYFQIGAIDGVTLMIVVLAMIGFNRTNPMLGIVFMVITIGVLSFFEIITYPIVMYPALALLLVWAFISTRKDD